MSFLCKISRGDPDGVDKQCAIKTEWHGNTSLRPLGRIRERTKDLAGGGKGESPQRVGDGEADDEPDAGE